MIDLIPAARTLDSSVDCRAAGMPLISRAAATPTLRAYQSALRAAGIMQDPAAIVAPYVHAGMTVLEPGPGMGFFTLELARLVGPAGRVIAVDVEPRMNQGVETTCLEGLGYS